MQRLSMTSRWIKSFSCGCLFVIAWGVGPLAWARETVITPDLLRIEDPKSWRLINGDCQAATEGGKSVLHLGPKIKATTGSSAALALVEGVEFSEGTLELDLKGRGKIERCFLGVAFNVADGKTFEAVYFRPFNFFREGFQDHSVQYVSWPVNSWEKLRSENPGTIRVHRQTRSRPERLVSRSHRGHQAKSERLGRRRPPAISGGESSGRP